MKQETHVLSRSLQLLMGGAYLLVLLVNGAATVRKWDHMELWEKVLFVTLLVALFCAAVAAVVRRQVREVWWSEERLVVRQGKRTLLDHAWSGELLFTEDLKNYVVTPRRGGRTLSFRKSLCSPALAAAFASRLQKID